jgi:hypothetical protein
MSDGPSTETEIRDAVVALLNNWVRPGVDAVAQFIGSVASDFTGFGTAPGEYFHDRAALRAMTEREHDAMRHPFTLRVPWMNARMLRESLALVEGELAVEIQTEDETFVEAPRFSMLLERDAGHSTERWVLLHVHMSVPDAMQDEGDTMGALLTTRTRELEREVARRTNALREQTNVLPTLNETNAVLAAELDLETLVQRLVNAGRDVIGAQMGAFFYNVTMHGQHAHADYALSGVPREAYADLAVSVIGLGYDGAGDYANEEITYGGLGTSLAAACSTSSHRRSPSKADSRSRRAASWSKTSRAAGKTWTSRSRGCACTSAPRSTRSDEPHPHLQRTAGYVTTGRSPHEPTIRWRPGPATGCVTESVQPGPSSPCRIPPLRR